MNAPFRYFVSLLILLVTLAASPARATSYTLTVVTQGSGTVTTNPTFATYPANVTVTLTAAPSSGWYFGGWSGGASGSVNPLNVSMTGNLMVTGLFLAYPLYPVTLTTNGQGAIDLNPLSATYTSNTVVTATATPVAGWVFTGWTGSTNDTNNPLSIAVNRATSLTGDFAELPAFTVLPQSITNVTGSTVSFSATAVGSGTLAYQWYYNSNPLPGAISSTLNLSTVTSAAEGFYDLVVTNNYGSVTSSVVALVLTNASQSTNLVSVCDEASLQAAISAGGWISIGCSGTITLTNTIDIVNNVILDASQVSAAISGDNLVRLFRVEAGASLAITNLTLANGSSIVTNGSAPADGGAIYNNGGSVTLTACTLTNNTALSPTSGGVARGGAIFNNGGAVQIYGSAISFNTAFAGVGPDYNGIGATVFGGAIYNTNGNLVIVDSWLAGNLTTNLVGTGNPICAGGAVYQASGYLVATNVVWSANQSKGGSAYVEYIVPTPASGGALAGVGGTMYLDQCQFFSNIAKGSDAGYHSAAGSAIGGAIFCSNVLTLISCSLSGNLSAAGNSTWQADYSVPTANGGAIGNQGYLLLRNSLLCSNQCRGGTALTLEGNSSSGNALGGGIFNAAMLAATNCTLTLNSAVSGQGEEADFGGGAAYNGNALGGGAYNASNATFVAVNTTVASNLCNAVATGISTASVSFSNGVAVGSQILNATNGTFQLLNSLLVDGSTNDNACGTITDLGDNISSDASANFESGSSYNNTDPLLGPLANNGGPTLTMALLPDSPAIDFADSTGAPPDDQRGYARPTGTGVISLGAYQYGATQIYGAPPSLNLAISAGTTNVWITFTAATNNVYHLQSSTNLTFWTDVTTFGAFSSPSNISQTISRQGQTRQFFRVMW